MRKISWLITVSAAAVLAAGIVYFNRGAIREAYESWTAPNLPPEEVYVRSDTARLTKVLLPKPQPPLPEGKSTSSLEQPSSWPTTRTPATTLEWPAEKLLAVPWMSQAPHQNWNLPYQEACEEASALMVRGYYLGERGRYDPNEADRRILGLVKFQKEQYGFYEDTSATATQRLINDAYPELLATVVPLTGADQIKSLIAEGIPVILPAYGKALPNPNFRNGGPLYHMLVVRGYTSDRFITNDPGTRKGEKFLYTYDGLLKAVHDWNNGDVPSGQKVMIIVKPRVDRRP